MSATRSAGTSGEAVLPGATSVAPSELRKRRRALGLTQADLAERLAVSANTVARWERGELGIGHPRQVARALARLERVGQVTVDGGGAGDQYGIGVALARKGIAATHQNDYARAQALLEQALRAQEQAGADRFYRVVTHAYLGRVYTAWGQSRQAEAALLAGLTLARELGSAWQAGVILSYLATLFLHSAEIQRARACALEGLALGNACGNKNGVSENLVVLGRAALAEGNPVEGVRLLEDALAHRRAGGFRRGVAEALLPLGMALQDVGHVSEAATHLREGLAYLSYPLIAVGLLIVRRRRPAHETVGTGSTGWIRGLLLIHAGVLGLLGAAMFLMPDLMVSVWPWPVTTTLVQAYSGPFLALAFCAGASADRRTWPDVIPSLLALLALHAGTLFISWLHGALFPGGAGATWVWFGGFGAGGVVVAAALAFIAQQRRAEAGRGTAAGRGWTGSAA